MAPSHRDPFSATNRTNGGAVAQKDLMAGSGYQDLAQTASPFGDKNNLLNKTEYKNHKSIDYLKSVIRDQNKEKELLTQHLEEAERDVKDLLTEFDRCKESQESVIDDLKERLMFLEKHNEALKEERARKMKDYEERLNIEKLNSEKDSSLAFLNFIQTAEKDFSLFCNRLNTDFSKYQNKIKDEVNTYKLKTKANFMAKETGEIKVRNSFSILILFVISRKPQKADQLAHLANQPQSRRNLQNKFVTLLN